MPKGTKKHCVIFHENISSLMIHPTAHYAVHSLKNINEEMFSRKNGEVFCFCRRVLVSQEHFLKFLSDFLAHKNAVKTNDNVRKSAKLEHQKHDIKK